MTTHLHSDANHLRTTREAFVKTIGAVAVFSPLSLATVGDALGREALVMPPTSRPFRRMGTIGLTLAERLRVSLFRHDDPEIPSSPCGYRIRLIGVDGELLGFGKGEIAPERRAGRTGGGVRLGRRLPRGLCLVSRRRRGADVQHLAPGVPPPCSAVWGTPPSDSAVTRER
jgi:hypothetical protein